MEKIKKEVVARNDDTRNEILYVRDDVRRMQGLYNPEKDETIKEFGNAKNQISEFLGDRLRQLENQIQDKLVKRIEVLEMNNAGAMPKINIFTTAGG